MSTRQQPAITCPECRSSRVDVINSRIMPSGAFVRARRCENCDRRFYTQQEPEFLIRQPAVRYWRKRIWLVEELEQQPDYQGTLARNRAKALQEGDGPDD